MSDPKELRAQWAEAFKDGQNPSNLAVAILVARVVRTLGESDNTFPKRFLKGLEADYHEIRELVSPDCLGLLQWTATIVRSGKIVP